MSPPGLIAAVVIAVGVKVSAVAVPGVLFGSVSLPVAYGRGALLSVAFFWAWLIWIVCSVRIAETNIAMNRLSLRFIIFEFPPRPLCRPRSIKSVEKL